MQIYIPLVFRLVCTNYWKTNHIHLFILLIILDQLDCWPTPDFAPHPCKNYEYQRNDKLGDISNNIRRI
jgi:hypothetical protein